MSLWDDQQSPELVRKFAALAETSEGSPRAVDEITAAAAPEQQERITKLIRFFFTEVNPRATTYMEHDYCTRYQLKHLVWALEQFAQDVKQQQTWPSYLARGEQNKNDEEEASEWKSTTDLEAEIDEAQNDEDEEAMEELKEAEEAAWADNDDDDDIPYAVEVDVDALACPTFDELFPPVDKSAMASSQCVPISVLAKTWNETGIKNHNSDLTVAEADEDAFHQRLNDALNSYVKTMLLEPRRLDAKFAMAES